MKADILRFFDKIAKANRECPEQFNYVVIVPLQDGVFVATNLNDSIIDDIPIDEIAETLKRADVKQPAKIINKGVIH